MLRNSLVLGAILSWSVIAGDAKEDSARGKNPVLWVEPTDIASRNLLFGQGGPEHAPDEGLFTFVEEDREGISPKFVVKDRGGVKWKVKLGPEARPETVVTRFVWAVGYSTDEDYLVPSQKVEGLPIRLHRGQEFVTPEGIVRDARWERMDHSKLGLWKWRDNPFHGSRELNGLRVLMSMFNNVDMKDSQNAVYENPESQSFVVSDLGATLGPTQSRWPGKSPKGDLARYEKSNFIQKIGDDYIDFAAPSWPMMFGFLPMPPLPYSVMTYPLKFVGLSPAPDLIGQRWIGKHVPRQDVAWIAGLLRQLTPAQIRNAFRAGAYSEEEVERFSAIMERRIRELDEVSRLREAKR